MPVLGILLFMYLYVRVSKKFTLLKNHSYFLDQESLKQNALRLTPLCSPLYFPNYIYIKILFFFISDS